MGESKCVTVSLEVRNFSYMTTEKRFLNFHVNCLNESSWGLDVTENDESSVNVYLACVALKDDKPTTLDFEISLLSESGSVLSRERKNDVEFLSGTSVLNPVVLKHDRKAEVLRSKCEEDIVIILCRMWNSKKQISCPLFYSAWSQVGVQQTTFIWRIANLKKLKCNGKKRINDIRNGLVGPKFSLEVFLVGETASKADLCLDIRHTRKIIPFVKSSWKVSVLDHEGNVIKSVDFNAKIESSTPFHAPTLLSKEDPIKDKILQDNEVSLVFDVKYSTGVVLHSVERVSYLPDQKDLFHSLPKEGVYNASSAGLQTDLLFMYREQILSDFEFRTGGQTFKVHKNILSARSPVFKAMFSGDMTEASGTGLDLTDITPDTLESLLTFIYTGTIDPLEFESAVKIYRASDKYEILPLRKICSVFLGSCISKENVCHILLMADMHQDSDLMSAAHEFITCYDDEIVPSTDWEEFLVKHPLLAALVMRTVLQKTRYSGVRK